MEGGGPRRRVVRVAAEVSEAVLDWEMKEGRAGAKGSGSWSGSWWSRVVREAVRAEATEGVVDFLRRKRRSLEGEEGAG